eukprot:SAG25_NODE_4051_length_901_cov_1.235661_1_plen_183_part_10
MDAVAATSFEASLTAFVRASPHHSQRPDDPGDPGQRCRVWTFPGLAASPWWEPPPSLAHTAALMLPSLRREAQALLGVHGGSSHNARHGAELLYGDACDDGWKTIDFMTDGRWVAANCARCPQIVELLCSLPLCRCSLARAYLSVLTAGKRIRPHHGRTNIKLRMQLPLLMGDDADGSSQQHY